MNNKSRKDFIIFMSENCLEKIQLFKDHLQKKTEQEFENTSAPEVVIILVDQLIRICGECFRENLENDKMDKTDGIHPFIEIGLKFNNFIKEIKINDQ